MYAQRYTLVREREREQKRKTKPTQTYIFHYCSRCSKPNNEFKTKTRNDDFTYISKKNVRLSHWFGCTKRLKTTTSTLMK